MGERTENSGSPAAAAPVREVRPVALGLLGLQHVLVMYAGAVAVPLIVGRALKLSPEDIAILVSADLFACGIATLIQSWGLPGIGILLTAIVAVLLNRFFNGLGSTAQAHDAALRQAKTAEAH